MIPMFLCIKRYKKSYKEVGREVSNEVVENDNEKNKEKKKNIGKKIMCVEEKIKVMKFHIMLSFHTLT